MIKKFEALKELGAGDFEHFNGALITHLKGTREILVSWNAPLILCDAGLYHAAYGTDGFDEKLVSVKQRSDIAELIGNESEELVYLYCACDRQYVFPKLGSSEFIEFRDRFSGEKFLLSVKLSKLFCELTVANEMELIFSSQSFKDGFGERLLTLFESMERFLSSRAIQAYSQALILDD